MNNLLSRYNIEFAHPHLLWGILLLPFIIWISYLIHRRRSTIINISSTEGIRSLAKSWKIKFRPVLTVLTSIAFVCLIIAIARPQKTNVNESLESEGIDIVLSIDISGSMLAEDFRPNRIDAAKATALQFIENRPTDRIGLVIFAGESFTQCPITSDLQFIKNQLLQIRSGMLEDGTAIGMGLATATDRLRDAIGKSRVVILMTDGVNNTGLIPPLTALEIAKNYKVRVYTIGVGSMGEALYPIQTQFGIQKKLMPVQIDEKLLKRISKETGGKYYRATNNSSLKEIYAEIDQLEKTKIKINTFKKYRDLYFPFAMIALCALVLELLLRYTLFKRVP